jgi:glycosyltransferase involved in cell wall biosynthesis
MKNLRIGLCHQAVMLGDAISNDIFGMYDVLASMGCEPVIFSEFPDPSIQGKTITTSFSLNEIQKCHLLIYHHSTYWEKGEELVNAFPGPVVLKFHNITPPHFFVPYSSHHVEGCTKGWKQTERLIQLKKPHFWFTDSRYNRHDLLALGESDERVAVVPPFNVTDQLLGCSPRAVYNGTRPYFALCIGRLAPNKGHLSLLRLMHTYKTHMGDNLVLRIVGTWDPKLSRYRDEIESTIRRFGLSQNVELLAHMPQRTVIDLLETSHVYICMSQHEGFCVPLIEAQAVGVPVVATDAGAKRETAGVGQLVAAEPHSYPDYLFYARLVEEVCKNASLRQTVIRNGQQNVATRFTRKAIEQVFLQALLPVLEGRV